MTPAPTGPPGVRLAVDVGTVRVGVAVSDPGGVLASPLATLARDPASDRDLDALAAAVAERSAVEVVVGLPRHLSGAEGRSVAMARDYAAALAARVAPVPVRLVDERLTTVSATRDLRAVGVRGRDQRAVVDQAAAVALLQGVLDADRSARDAAARAAAGAAEPPPDLPDLPPPDRGRAGRGGRGGGTRGVRGGRSGRGRGGRSGRL